MRLTIKLIVTLPNGYVVNDEQISHRNELTVWSKEVSNYYPEFVNEIISEALQAACNKLGKTYHKELKSFFPELSAHLFADECGLRPSLHINAETIVLMSEAGCAFDFDPYI